MSTERKPLLSDEASGELRAVELVKFIGNDYDCLIQCSKCKWGICWQYVEDRPMNFCPGCGNKIAKP